MAEGPGARPIAVWCKTCRRKLLVRARDAGKRGRCVVCGAEVLIPLMSESGPPAPPPGFHPHLSAEDDRTIMLERIGRRSGLIAGGVVVGLVLVAMIVVFAYMLLSGPSSGSAEAAIERPAPAAKVLVPPPPLAPPAVSAPAVRAPAWQSRPAVGITFANAGKAALDLGLEPVGGGLRTERTLKPGQQVTLGLRPGTYKATWGASGVQRVQVTMPEIWVFAPEPSAPGGWKRHIR